ncbi:MAG: type II toxin-antitoxin system VapC family toxin [Rhizomicrobium sp.]
MNYHFDTNTAIGFIKGFPKIRHQAAQVLERQSSISLSSIVLFELWYGVANGHRFQEDAAALRAFLAERVHVIPFGDAEANAAGEIRATLKAAGTPIGPYDLLIAAHAVRLGATLVTANVREFSRVPGLKWEDWSA